MESRLALAKAHGYGGKKVDELKENSKIAKSLLAGFLIALALVLFWFKPEITGFFAVEDKISYSDDVDILTDGFYEYEWVPENNGRISSVKIDGWVENRGRAEVYLVYNGGKYKIFDSLTSETGIGSITGFALSNQTEDDDINETTNQTTDELVNETAVNQTINETETNQTTINETINQTAVNETEINQTADSITISLEYKPGTEYDIDDNGIESTSSMVDFTVENSLVDADSICTKWGVYSEEDLETNYVCYGNNSCCNHYGLESLSANWNDIFYGYYGLLGATLNNRVYASVAYINEDGLLVKSSEEWLSMKFYYPSIKFEDYCLETCSVSFNATSYKLIVNTSNSSIVIDKINYELVMVRNVSNIAPRLLKNVSDMSINSNENYSLDLSEYFYDEDELIYDAYSAENITIVIDDGVATIIPDYGFEGVCFMFFIANDSELIGVTNVFKINVSKEEDLTQLKAEIGKPVKWVKKSKEKIISIAEHAANISVYKIVNNQKIKVKKNKIKIKDKLKKKELTIEDEISEFEVEYYTPGPVSSEEVIDISTKIIVISSDIHYKDILAYTSIENEATANNVHLYWLVNDSRQEVNADKYDKNNNNLIDYIEWIVPSLSNQTYEVVITYDLSTFDQGSHNLTYYNGSALVMNHTGDNYTKLLLHFNGNDEDTTTSDSSGKGHVVYFQGDTKINASNYKFGGSGVKFDGTGDYLNLSDSDDWDLFESSADATIDFWVKHTDHVGEEQYILQIVDGTHYWAFHHLHGTGIRFVNYDGATLLLFSGTEITDTSWHHVALVKDGNDYNIYLDGIIGGEATDSDTANYAGPLIIGTTGINGGSPLNGSIDELRITKGTARWTGNFTPPSREYGTGAYESEVYDYGMSITYENISWYEYFPYGQELPSDQTIETEYEIGNINMTGNVLLMHFNNDSDYGENDTHVYDFSGHCYDNETEILTLSSCSISSNNSNLPTCTEPIECPAPTDDVDSDSQLCYEPRWKLFSELNKNEKVMTLNQKTREKEWQLPLEYQEFDYNKDMYKIELEDGSDLLVSEKHRVYSTIEEKNDLVSFVMMGEVFKNKGISFNTKSQYKASDMHPLEMAHVPFEVLDMGDGNNIHHSELRNLLLQSNEQNRILAPELLHDLFDVCDVNSHNDSHHLLNSSTVIALPEGILSIFFNFSTYSGFMGNSSTGCQSIFSQNSFSSLDNSLLLMNSSKILLLLDSSLATSDQFTHGKRSNLSLNLSSIGVIKLAIYNAPLACNFSNSSSLFLIPSFMTSGQLMSGCLSNFSLNSLDTDTVNLFIFNTPHNCSSKHKCVDVYKSFDFDNNLDKFSLQPITEVYSDYLDGKEVYFLDDDNPVKIRSIEKVEHDGEMYNIKNNIKTEKGDLLVSEKHRVYAGNKENELQPVLIDPIVVIKVLEDDNAFFESENQYKTTNVDSPEFTQVMPQVLEMLNSSNVSVYNLLYLLSDSNCKSSIFSPEFIENLFQTRNNLKWKTHFRPSSLSNFSKVIRECGSFSIFFNFSIYSSLNGSQSPGIQSIFSQNFQSSSDSLPVLTYLSNSSFLRDSSLPTSDQFTHENLDILCLNDSSNGTVMHAIYSSPLACNLSNASNLFFSPCLNTSGQFTSGLLSILFFNSSGMENVVLIIFSIDNTSCDCIDICICMFIYKSFDFDKNSDKFSLQPITEVYSDYLDGKEVYFLDSSNEPVKVKSISKEKYDGKIYDVDVENDVVLVRRSSQAPDFGNKNAINSVKSHNSFGINATEFNVTGPRFWKGKQPNFGNDSGTEFWKNCSVEKDDLGSDLENTGELAALERWDSASESLELIGIWSENLKERHKLLRNLTSASNYQSSPLIDSQRDAPTPARDEISSEPDLSRGIWSGNSNNGTAYVNNSDGSIRGPNATGKFGMAYEFDGVDDYVDAGNMNFAGSVTIGAWIYIETMPTGDDYDGVVHIGNTGLHIGVEVGNTLTFHDPGVVQVYGSTVFTAGKWYYVVATQSGTAFSTANTKLYVNGVQESTTLSGSGSTNFTGNTYISYNDDNSDYFDGTIDEVAIWNRTLSATDILNIYKRGALRLNLSVRSCDDAACSGEAWTDIDDSSPQNLTVSNDQYFQYRADFETDNTLYTPELFNVTIIYTNVSEAIVALNSPADNNHSVNFSSVVFNCSANTTQADGLSNISLYSDYNGTWKLIETKGLNGTFNSTAFTRDILTDKEINGTKFIDNSFKWNCLAYNEKGDSGWGDSNFTFTSWNLNSTHYNTTTDNDNVTLGIGNSSGLYESKFFDAGSLVSFDNISWKFSLASLFSTWGLFTTNETTDYKWSAGDHYQTKAVGNENVSLNTSLDNYTKLLLHFDGADGYNTNETADATGKHTFNFTGDASYNTTAYKFGNASARFNGSGGVGGYLVLADSGDWDIGGGGDFTIDLWVKHDYHADYESYVCQYEDVNNRMYFRHFHGNGLQIAIMKAGDWKITMGGAGEITDTNWHHVAAVRNGDRFDLFLDGTSINNGTISANHTLAGELWIGDDEAGGATFSGHIDELRISKGIARWTGNFTPPAREYPLYDVYGNYTSQTFDGRGNTASWTNISWKADLSSGGQQLDNYTKLLMHMDGDASASNHDYTVNGTPKLNASVPANNTAAFGGSMYFDGAGDYLSLADSGDWSFDGDFTIDAWVRFDVTGSDDVIIANWDSNDNAKKAWILNKDTNDDISFIAKQTDGTTVISITSSSSVLANTWYHMAIVRSGSTATLYIDGEIKGSDSSATITTSSTGNPILVGVQYNTLPTVANPIAGSIDELRISKGIARWTANFTPPTAPYSPDNDNISLTVDENVTLMLHFDGDESASNHTVTFFGNPSANATEYRFDGSYYFDGVDDYLSINDSEDWAFGSDDFTIDFWVRFDEFDASWKTIWGNSAADTDYVELALDSNGIDFLAKESDVMIVRLNEGGYTGWSADTWYHVAVVRNGDNWNIYQNGVSVANTINSSAIPDHSAPVEIGRSTYQGGVGYFNGSLDEFRISKGIARWTQPFDPPVRKYPFNRTDITIQTRTSDDDATWTNFTPVGGKDDYNVLLLNFDGADGFNTNDTTDATERHRLTFYNEAHYNTSTYKFGTAAAKFDGTGDYISIPDSSDWNFGSEFTIDFWVDFSSLSSNYDGLLGTGSDSSYSNAWVFYYSEGSNQLQFQIRGNSVWDLLKYESWSASANTKYHIAIVRNSLDNIVFYVDGNQVGGSSYFSGTVGGGNNPLVIGNDRELNFYHNGSIDELRISKGIARWTANFTVPSGPYTDPLSSPSGLLNDSARYLEYKANFQTESSSYSPVLEWVNVSYSNNKTTNLTLQTRTSDDAASWSSWSSWHTNPSNLIDASARYLQYRANLSTQDTSITPYLEEVNISYTNIADPPTVYLESPANNTLNTTSSQPSFIFNVTDVDSSLFNCTLYINNSGTVSAFGADSDVSSDTSTNITANASLSNGNYWWWVNCTDAENVDKSDEWNISIDITAMTTLNTPINNNNSINFSNVVFNCSANTTDVTNGLSNISLYSDYNGTWSLIATNSLTGVSNATTFTRNILTDKGINGTRFIDNSFKWNCLAYDDAGNSDWGDSNRTFTSWNLNSTYYNTTTDNDNVTLGIGNSSGLYESKFFDAGSLVSFDNISWKFSLASLFSTWGLFTTNETTDYKWSAGDHYQTKAVGNENVSLNTSLDNYTKLLLHFDGADGYNTDETTDTTGKHTFNFSGDASYNTTNYKFGNASGYFDGTGDYLSLADSLSDFAYGSNDFTIDFWVNPKSFAALSYPFSQYAGSYSGVHVQIATNATIRLYAGDGGSYEVDITTSNNLILNNWNHIAVVRNGDNWDIYINGVKGASTIQTPVIAEPSSVRVSNAGWGGDSTNGSIDELRISKGIARWTGNFTPPAKEYPLYDVYGNYTSQTFDGSANANWTNIEWKADLSSGGQDVDNYTKLLLHMDGDASASNHGYKVNGTPKLNASMPANNTAAFGGSMYFDGDGDYLSLADSADWDFSDDFTFETWVYFNNVADTQRLFSRGEDHIYLLGLVSGKIKAYLSSDGANWDIVNDAGSITIVAKKWTHIAFVRNGSTYKTYIDGVQDVSVTDATDHIASATAFLVGALYDGSQTLNGSIDELRISKGTARWTGNFTPPTAPYSPDNDNVSLTVDENVTLMLHFDGDESDSNHTVTFNFNGSANVNATEYKFDGSYYFDGDGDYLEIADSDDWDFGSGDFTVDFWWNLASLDAMAPVSKLNTASGLYWQVFRTTTNLYFYGSNGVAELHYSWSPSTETWYHIAVVRNGDYLTLYVDGTSIGSGDISGWTNGVNGGADELLIGRGDHDGNTYDVNGSIDELRISKGIARWTSNFDPPVRKYPFNRTDITIQTRTSDDAATWTNFTPVGGKDDYNVLLLDFDGADGFNTNDTTDATERHRLTFINQSHYNTSTYKFGTAAAKFDGDGDYISISDSPDWDFGSDDFTVDAWIYPTAWDGDTFTVTNQYETNDDWITLRLVNSGALSFETETNSGAQAFELTAGTATVQLNQWSHIAFVRKGSANNLYHDGVSVASDTNSDTYSTITGVLSIGRLMYNSGTYNVANGSIDELRISKGIARWTENFTVPSGPYTEPLSSPSGMINDSARYLEYKANFQTESSSYSPVLEWVNVSYSANKTTNITFQTRTSDDAVTWGSWSSPYTNSSNSEIGLCVAENSLIAMADKTKKKITEIKPGDYVQSLDEKTNKIVSNKVMALLDMGEKPIYELITESGRAINTTGNHPYLVKVRGTSEQTSENKFSDGLEILISRSEECLPKVPADFSAAGNHPYLVKCLKSDMLDSGAVSKSSSCKVIKYPLKSSGSDFFLSNIENAGANASGLSCGILIQIIENTLSFGNGFGLAKSESLVTNTRFSDLESSANLPFENPFGANFTSNPSELRNLANLLLTFSSSRNLSCEWDADSDIVSTSGEICCILQSCFNIILCQGGKIFENFIYTNSSFKHLQDLPDHNSGAFKSGLSMADFSVCNNILVNFDSHTKLNNSNEVFKGFGEHLKVVYLEPDKVLLINVRNTSNLLTSDSQHEYVLAQTDTEWVKVIELKTGDEIAVADSENNKAVWGKISLINVHEKQQVYDLEIENTHNFIANDIIAHNTNRYIQYRANLSTQDTSITPYLEEVNISYSQIGAIYTLFEGQTTNFNENLSNMTHCNATLEKLTKGIIKWHDCVNAFKADFDSYVQIEKNLVDITTVSLNSTFNSSANITFYNLSFTEPVILRDGERCSDSICVKLAYTADKNLTFNVTHFTNYTSTENVSLTIYDETDAEGGNINRGANETVKFFANYSYKNGTAVAFGNCSINFSDSFGNMSYNASSALFEYNRTFVSTGTKYYNVSCNSTAAATNINASDDIEIYQALGVILNKPVDNNNSVNFSNIVFNCSATDVQGLSNISLYSDYNVSWSLIATQDLTGTSNSTTFTRDILTDKGINGTRFIDSNFIWNCLAYDSSGNSDWGDSNFTFTSWNLNSTHYNTTTDNDNVTLGIGNSSGLYESKFFDAGSLVSFDNISWKFSLASLFSTWGLFTTNETGDYKWSSGVFYQTKVVGNENVSLNTSMDNYTKLLLHFDGADGYNTANTLDDSGKHYFNFSGDARYNTSQYQFGNASCYFDGVGDYLSLADSEDWDFGSGNFTIDMRVKFSSTSGEQAFLGLAYAVGQRTWMFSRESTGELLFTYSTDGTDGFHNKIPWSPSANIWYHLAVVRHGSDQKLFVDGSQIGNTTNMSTSSINSVSTETHRIGSRFNEAYFNGSIDELRISKGIARWTGNFTPPAKEYPLYDVYGNYTSQTFDGGINANWTNIEWKADLSSGGQQLDNYTKLLLHMDGDASASNHDYTVNGTPKLNASVPANNTDAFGGNMYFDGDGDYLTIADSDDWYMDGDYTIDAWMKITGSLALKQTVIYQKENSSRRWGLYFNGDKGIQFLAYNDQASYERFDEGSNSGWDNNWHHVAVTIEGGQDVKVYKDGGLVANGTFASQLIDFSGNVSIGVMEIGNGPSYMNGSLDELRISKGVARWTANFTPPSAPYTPDNDNISLTVDENVTLMLHFDGDESDSNHTVTFNFNGSANVNATEYKFDGSYYFDGDGDYLSIPDSDDWDFGSGDWTIDLWVRFDDTSGEQWFFSQRDGNGLTWWRKDSDHRLHFFARDTVPSSQGEYKTAGVPTINADTWYHIAFVRSGSSAYIFLDGVSLNLTQTTALGTFPDLSTIIEIGKEPGGANHVNGSIDEYRISKGIARWNYTFDVPPRAYPYNITDITLQTRTSNDSSTWTNWTPVGGDDKYNVLLLHFDGADGFNTNGTTDVTERHRLTFINQSHYNTSNYKFGTAAAKFDGVGDYISIPDSGDWTFGDDDFTIDMWVKHNSLPGDQQGWVGQDSVVNEYWEFRLDSSGARFVDYSTVGGGTIVSLSQGSLSGWAIDTWYHIALVKSGNDYTIYRDGVSIVSTNDPDALTDYSAPLHIGLVQKANSGGFELNGSIDELRITKGLARWTANFTVPSGPYTEPLSSPSGMINDSARYLEYKANFFTESSSYSPVLEWVNLSYINNKTTNITLQTRTSDDASTWSSWSSWHTNPSNLIDASARYLQYRANLSTEDTSITPYLEEVNISYTDVLDPPTVYLESPANNTLNTTSVQPEFRFNITDLDSSLFNCTLYINNSGTITAFGADSDVSSDTSTNITANASLSNGNYYWWVNCTDAENVDKSEIRNLSISITAETTLNSPVDNNNSINFSNAVFNCSANTTLAGGLTNISLYSDHNSSWQLIETKTISGASAAVNFTRNIYADRGNNSFIDSNFIWNCLAYDTAGNSDWGDSNYTFSGWDLGSYNMSYLNSSAIVVNDTGDNYTKLLLHMNGDFSSQNHIYTANGTPRINASAPANNSEAFGGSMFFDGAGDYLAIDSSSDFNFSTDPFTVDAWINVPDVSGVKTIFDVRENHGDYLQFRLSNAVLSVAVGVEITSSISIPVNTWTHVALVSDGSVATLYVNGVANGTDTSVNQLGGDAYAVTVGCYRTTAGANGECFKGYIDELRITKGTARWTANFTPPNSPYTNPDNDTKLLLHFDGDMSGNNHTIIFNGNVSANSSANSNASDEGAYYFDGAGDYLTIADSGDWDFGSGDFTIDMWMMFDSLKSNQYLISQGQDSNNGWLLRWYLNSLELMQAEGDWGNPTVDLKYSWNPSTDIWYHIAAIKSGTTFYLSINGDLVNSTTDSTSFADFSAPIRIGVYDGTGGQDFNGSIDELRITKGLARWTGNFTPPSREYGTGSYTSKIFDPGANVSYNNISWSDSVSAGTNITLQARTSYDASAWSSWSSNLGNPSNLINSSTRYIQYKTEFTTNNMLKTPQLLADSVNINYSSISADSCSCPASGPWNIINEDKCTLSVVCDIEDEQARIQNGSLKILSGGQLRAGGFSFENSQNFSIESGGGLSIKE